jgi:hypothetical protein
LGERLLGQQVDEIIKPVVEKRVIFVGLPRQESDPSIFECRTYVRHSKLRQKSRGFFQSDGPRERTRRLSSVSRARYPLLASISPIRLSSITFVKPFTNESLLKQPRTTSQVAGAINDGWLEGGSFVSSILAGTLLGLLADHWLGTDPWLVVIGIIVGAYSGFVRVWRYSIKMEEDPRER